jgi:hypothetical protein
LSEILGDELSPSLLPQDTLKYNEEKVCRRLMMKKLIEFMAHYSPMGIMSHSPIMVHLPLHSERWQGADC